MVDEVYPQNSCLDLHLSPLPVEVKHTLQVAHIHQQTIRRELLPSHRMPRPGDTDRLLLLARPPHDPLQLR